MCLKPSGVMATLLESSNLGTMLDVGCIPFAFRFNQGVQVPSLCGAAQRLARRRQPLAELSDSPFQLGHAATQTFHARTRRLAMRAVANLSTAVAHCYRLS